jgi:hypothetical protein
MLGLFSGFVRWLRFFRVRPLKVAFITSPTFGWTGGKFADVSTFKPFASKCSVARTVIGLVLIALPHQSGRDHFSQCIQHRLQVSRWRRPFMRFKSFAKADRYCSFPFSVGSAPCVRLGSDDNNGRFLAASTKIRAGHVSCRTQFESHSFYSRPARARRQALEVLGLFQLKNIGDAGRVFVFRPSSCDRSFQPVKIMDVELSFLHVFEQHHRPSLSGSKSIIGATGKIPAQKSQGARTEIANHRLIGWRIETSDLRLTRLSLESRTYSRASQFDDCPARARRQAPEVLGPFREAPTYTCS